MRSPLISFSSNFVYGGTGTSTDVASFGSHPAVISYNNALSYTVFVICPIVSKDEAMEIMPYRDTRPYVGFIPTKLQYAAGRRMELPVSVPVPARLIPVATATADPELDPPGTRVTSYGLRVAS